MANPKWDDTETIEDIPSFDDTEEIVQEDDKPSMLESAGRGAVQGASLGWGEELASAVMAGPSMLYKNVAENIPGTPEFTDARLREQGFTGDIGRDQGSSDLLENYRSLRDTGAEANKAAKEENPIAYGTGEFAGAIAPTIAMGGGNLAAGSGLKAAGKVVAQGALEGGISGAGVSEADLTKGEVEQFAKDTGTGAAIGGVAGYALPIVGKGLAKTAKGTGKLIKESLEELPGVEALKTGFKLGKKGIKLEPDVIKEEIKDYSGNLLKKIRAEFQKSGIKKDKAMEELNEIGIRINAGEPVQDLIDEVMQRKAINLEDKHVKQKVVDLLESFKNKESPVAKSIKRMEKRRAKQALKMERQGAELRTSTDFDSEIDEVLPLPETKGTVRGVEDKYKMPDGSEKKVISTDFDEAVVGPQVPQKNIDLDNASLDEIDEMLKYTKGKSGDLTQAPKDEVEKYSRDLAMKLKAARTKALEGDVRILDENKIQSKMFKALEDSGVKKSNKGMKFSEMDSPDMRDQMAKFQESRSFGKQLDQDRFFDRLEEVSPDFKPLREEQQLLSKGMGLASGEAAGSTSLKGLLGSMQNIAGSGANIIGRAGRGIGKSTPVQITKKIMSIPPTQLAALSKRSPAVAKFGNVIQKIIDDPSKSDVIMWTLSRQPGFRKAVQDALGEEENE